MIGSLFKFIEGEEFTVPENIMMKPCIYCNELKPLSEYHIKPTGKDGHDNRCRTCKNDHKSLVDYLKKLHPKKSDICDCCKRYSSKIVFDHHHDLRNFRGWVCENCNTGIGKLDDDSYGIILRLLYVMRHEMKFNIKNFDYNPDTKENEITAVVDEEALIALVRMNIVELLKKHSPPEEDK